MSTRQQRLQDKSKIAEKLAASAGKKIQIVFNDQTVLLGSVVKLDDQMLVAVNMRLKEVTIPLEQISEVYLDSKE
jgi:ribosome maturation factor RimP